LIPTSNYKLDKSDVVPLYEIYVRWKIRVELVRNDRIIRKTKTYIRTYSTPRKIIEKKILIDL